MGQVELKLSGSSPDGGGIDMKAAAKAMEALANMIEALDPDGLSPAVANMRMGSVVAVASVSTDTETRVNKGMRQLQNGLPPTGWSQAALNALHDISALPGKGGIAAAAVATVLLTPRMHEVIGHAAKEDHKPVSRGAVRGRLYSYSSNDGYKARLTDREGRTVHVDIADENVAQQAREHLDRQVQVEGIVERDPNARSRAMRVHARHITPVHRRVLRGTALDESIREAQKIVAELKLTPCDSVESIRELRYG